MTVEFDVKKLRGMVMSEEVFDKFVKSLDRKDEKGDTVNPEYTQSTADRNVKTD
jgi:tetrahydromethanopterin S-methyltransferase subunit G